MANITAITSKYVPQYVGGIDKEVNSLLKDYQTKQDTVLNSANELNDSFGIAASQLDATDRESFNKYTAGIKENLKKYTENDYVGNLDRKIIHDSNQFKSIYSVFQDNTKRKQKFIDDISKSGLSEDKQQKYLALANKKNGSLQYDPITQGVNNKFSPIEVIKNPDVNKMINLLDGQIPKEKGYDYMSPDGKQFSSVPRPELNYVKREYDRKIINDRTIANINNKLITDPEYNNFYQRNIELGGKKYAEEEHSKTLQSIVSGLKVGEFNSQSFKTDDMVEYGMKQSMERASKKAIERESDLVGDSILETPINFKTHNFENLADLTSEYNKAFQSGDKDKVTNLANYINKFEKKYGVTYGQDYEQLNLGITKKQRILNDAKKHLVEQATEDIKQDAMNTTSSYKSFGFNKEADNKIMDRNFQQMLGNLTSKNTLSDDKTNALYTPMDIKTNEPLSIKQMQNLKNAQFGSSILTSHGVYYTGRSNGSNKEQDSSGSTDSDFNFLLKVPNQLQVLTNLENLHNITSGQKKAYIKLQGLDDNYGNFKTIDVRGSKLMVKKLLPSDGEGTGYKVKNTSGTKTIATFEELVDLLGTLEK